LGAIVQCNAGSKLGALCPDITKILFREAPAPVGGAMVNWKAKEEKSWQGKSGFQSHDMDCVGSIQAMPQHRLPALLIISINQNVCVFVRSINNFNGDWVPESQWSRVCYGNEPGWRNGKMA
jgi:hypothetical protein